ncbi:MAG: hypothetical protein ACK55Z_09080, partial [bacterium]
MAFVPASTSSVNRVGTGPAIRSPSQRVDSIGHCARQIVGTLSLNRKNNQYYHLRNFGIALPLRKNWPS